MIKVLALWDKTGSKIGIKLFFECLNLEFSPGWYGSVVWVWSCGWGLGVIAGSIPGGGTCLGFGFGFGSLWDAADGCVSFTLMFLSASFSLPSPLSKNKWMEFWGWGQPSLQFRSDFFVGYLHSLRYKKTSLLNITVDKIQLAFGYFKNVFLFLKLPPPIFFHFVSGRGDSCWRWFVVGWGERKFLRYWI